MKIVNQIIESVIKQGRQRTLLMIELIPKIENFLQKDYHVKHIFSYNEPHALYITSTLARWSSLHLRCSSNCPTDDIPCAFLSTHLINDILHAKNRHLASHYLESRTVDDHVLWCFLYIFTLQTEGCPNQFWYFLKQPWPYRSCEAATDRSLPLRVFCSPRSTEPVLACVSFSRCPPNPIPAAPGVPH